MAEFGLQTRQAISEVNDIVIDPPALRVNPRDVVTQRRAKSTGWEQASQQIGNSLGKALQQFTDENAALTKEKQLQETIARQGLETTINKEDAKLARTGWAKQFYGQNAQYSVAQKIAAQNSVRQKAMELEASIDSFATVNPEHFKQTVLQPRLEEMLKGYENDPESRTLITNEWIKTVPNIVRHQYQSWYGNSQKEIFEKTKENILTNSDYWTQQLDTALNNGDDDFLADTVTQASTFIQGGGKPEGMKEEAWQRAKMEALSISMTEGNKNLYDLMDKTGQLKQLNARDARTVKTALSAYDTRWGKNIDTTWASTEEDLNYTSDMDEGIQIVKDFMTELDALERRGSGSEQANFKIADAKRKASRRLRALMQDVSKRSVKEEDFDKLVDSFNLPFVERISYQAPHSNEERGRAFDAHLKKYMEDYGIDVSNEELIGKQILLNPELSKVLSKKLVNEPTESKIVKSMISSIAQGWQNLFDAEGKLTPEAGVMIQSIENLRNVGALNRYMTQTDMKDFEAVLDRVKKGVPAAVIEKDMTAIKQARTTPVSPVEKAKGQTQYQADLEYVNALAREVYKTDLNTESRVRLRDQFLEGLSIYGNDLSKAREYVRARLDSDAIVVNKQLIHNAAKVKEFSVSVSNTDGKDTTETLSLETVLNNGGDMLNYLLAMGKSTTLEEYNKLHTKPFNESGYSVHVDDEYDGVYIDGPGLSYVVPISKEILQTIANSVVTKREQQRKTRAAISDKEYEEALNNLYMMHGFIH